MKTIVISEGSVGLQTARILAEKEVTYMDFEQPIILSNQTFGKICTSKLEANIADLIKQKIDLTLTEIKDYPDGREKRRERRKQQRKNK